MTATPSRLAVCACTFRRPAGLARLLAALAELEPVPGARVRVVISDNDSERSAEGLVSAAVDAFPVELLYVCAPERGIAQARNAALDAAGDVDAVLVVDDDEWPDPGWLRAMVEAWRRHRADVVTAPVVPVFDEPAPDWAVQGGFFERDRFPTGTELHYARTSNVLIGRAVLEQSGLRFRTTASGGGEDTLFFEQARAAGHRIVWADDAIVRESVPASRVQVRWLLTRSYRYGLTRSELLRLTGAPWWRRGRRVVNGLLTLLLGLVAVLPGAARGRVGLLAAGQRTALGAGLVAGAVGAAVDEYDRVHGA